MYWPYFIASIYRRPNVTFWQSTAAAEQRPQRLNLNLLKIPNLGASLKRLINFVMLDSSFHIPFTHIMIKGDQ